LSDNADAFAEFFNRRHVIVLGYAGWQDSIMKGLRHRTTKDKSVYWCDIKSPERAAVELNEDVRTLIKDPKSGFNYVSLGAEGADAFMADLYRRLHPDQPYPRLLSDPFPLLVDRLEKMQLGNVRLFAAATPTKAAGADGASEGPPSQSEQGPTADAYLGHLVARLRAVQASWTGAPAPTTGPPTPEQPRAENLAPPIPEPQTLALDAEAATAAGRWSDAIAAWDRVLHHPATTTGLRAQAFASRGYCRGQLRDSQAEIEDYTAAIELPGAPPDQVARSLVNRGITLGQAGETVKALTDFTAAIDLPGASPERVAWALVSRGLLYNTASPHNPKRAMADFTRAVDLPGAPPERVVHGLMARGLTRGRRGDTEGAIRDYTQAIELPGASSHDVAEALVLRGRARFQDGRGDAAAFRQDCEAAVSREDSPVRRLWLGHALLFEGRDSAALDAYRRGLEQAPARADIIDATKRIHAGIQSEWLSRDRAAPVLRLLDQARLQSRGPASDETALP
jgi:tetratricopeptide (TPR) repeat protein